MKYIITFIRIVVGLLFIFSGLIKANDPLGLSYKMNEFFEVWHVPGLAAWSLTLSVLMIGFEIIAGIALLLGAAFRVFSFLLLLLTVFFTFLTAYVYLTDKIKECGCFGDCIKITNAETFWKDVILLALVLVLFAFRKRIKPLFNGKITATLMVITVILAFGIQWYTLNNLPYYDCLPYKKGANIWEKMQPPPGATRDVFKTVMIYQKDGVKKEFDETNYPWQDSTWTFVDSKSVLVQKGNAEPAIKDVVISDYSGNDQTQQILTEKGYTFLLFIKDPAHANTANLDRIRQLAATANQLNIPFYILCSAGQQEAEAFMKQHHLEGAQWMTIDGTVSKTAMRSNPGLMLLRDGTVTQKWSFRNYPASISMNNNKLVY